MISKELRHKSEQLVCTWKTDVFSSMKNSTYDLNQKIEDVSSQNTFPSKQIFNSHVLSAEIETNSITSYTSVVNYMVGSHFPFHLFIKHYAVCY